MISHQTQGLSVAIFDDQRQPITCRVSAISVQDITIVFDDDALTDIRTNSSVLMLASPVFNKMLSQDMKEKKTKQVELPGKCPEEFKVLLEFLQPVTGRLQKVSDENLDLLLRWCDEYCIDILHKESIEFLKAQPPSVQRVVQAYRSGLHDYAEKWIDHLLKNGEKDWSMCYKYPDLVQKVLERNFELMPPPQLEILYKKGDANYEQKLACRKCRQFYYVPSWHCKWCRSN